MCLPLLGARKLSMEPILGSPHKAEAPTDLTALSHTRHGAGPQAPRNEQDPCLPQGLPRWRGRGDH